MSFNARIKSKRDTASNWETNNPVLLNGELIIVDTNAGDVRFKIGDGVKTYTQLPFQDESLYNVLSTKADSADLESIQASIVQSDLSQTDNTAIDYIKGIIRQESLPEGYPYRETVGTILDGTFEFADSDGIYQYQITDENFAIVDNESYAVIWDGKTYRCAATNFNGYAIVLGNLAIANVGDDTGEPFLLVYQGNQSTVGTKDTSTTHTVTVCAETTHQIADDFIPDTGRGMILKNFNGVMPSPANWSSVTYGNDKFVAVPYLYNQAAYREDDLTWKTATLPSSVWWISVTYGNGKFVTVAFDRSTTAAYSTDGITWTAATLPSTADWRSVTYGNGKFVAVASDSTTAAYSEDGITWTAATLPSTADWRSVAYGNDKFVAAAYNSTAAAYSEDGITWTAATLPSTAKWNSVTYGNNKFVAVTSGSDKAAYSSDGITWTATTMPISDTWNSVTYGNGKFVAVIHRSDKAAYSTDGITWTATTMPSSERWMSVTYGNGKFVAVVNGSTTVAYSRDGINWKTELALISQNGIDVTDGTLIALNHIPDLSQTDSTQVDYVKGVLRNEHLPEGYPYKELGATILDGTFEFMSIDTSLKLYQIEDENFTIVHGRPYIVIWNGVSYECVSYGNAFGNFAIANAGDDTGEPFLFLSYGVGANYIYARDTSTTNTITVCEETVHPIADLLLPEIAKGLVLSALYAEMPNNGEWYSVTCGKVKFVAVACNSTKAAYSEDGITWKSSTLPSSAWWRSVTYGNDKFVAVAGENSTVAAYSEDGITWTAATLPSSANWRSVTYGNGKFVTVAYNSNKAAYSEDGITWTAATLPSSANWRPIAYGNGKFVIMEENSTAAAYSEDGITWTAATLPSSAYWNSVTYGNGKFVAVAYDSNTAAYSEDGITWTAAILPSAASWSSVTYGNDKFVAVASTSNKAAYSEDGITWTAATLPSSTKWSSVTYGNGKFVTVASESNTAAYSEDGINWNTSFVYISQNGEDVTADTLIALNHTPDLSQTDPTHIDYVKGVIRQESLPEGYPYITKKIIEWDGNTTDKVAVSNTFYKVSDEIPSNDELKENGIMYATQNANQTTSSSNISQIWDTYISYGTITDDYAFLEYIAVIRNANTEISGATFPEPGTYFMKQGDTWVTKLDYSKVSKLDDKYFDSAYVIDVKVGQADNGDETFTLTSGNFSDAYTAYLNKKIIIMQMDGYSGNTLVCVGADTSDQLKFADLTKNLNYFRIRILQFASDNTISVYQENNLAYYDHTQSASKISAGTFAGQVVANANAETSYTTYQVRNSAILSATPSSMTNGEIAFVYS